MPFANQRHANANMKNKNNVIKIYKPYKPKIRNYHPIHD